MTAGITLSAGVRSNLLSLQDTAALMNTTQNRLATGKAVNSALDNPLNFFTSSSLGARASDLSGLLDNMSNGIQTIQTANNGLTAITGLIQQLQATVAQARSDATSGTTAATPGTGAVTGTTDAGGNTSSATNNALTFDIGGGVKVSITTATHSNAVVSTVTGTGAPVGTDATASTLTVDDGSGAGVQTVTFASTDNTTAKKITAINTQLTAAGSTVSAALDSNGKLVFTNSAGKATTVTATSAIQTDLGLAATATSTDGSPDTTTKLTLTQLADAVNNNAQLSGKVSATLTGPTGAPTGITFNNLSTTTDVAVTGLVTGGSGHVTGAATDTATITKGSGGTISSTRQSLLNQFNSLLTQINTTASDSGYNGINLLNGDSLKLAFNETGTSSINIQTKDSTGATFAINATNLGITSGTASQFGDNTQLDTLSTNLTNSLTSLRTQASSLGSSLSVVQTRQDFTKSMINSLQTGADNLVLADTNQEGANLLALQTRQSLSTTALSLSAQSDKAVLQLFQ
jgi:flagellin-like hook-associated protein FlgL